jgi:hypothetical protein
LRVEVAAPVLVLVRGVDGISEAASRVIWHRKQCEDEGRAIGRGTPDNGEPVRIGPTEGGGVESQTSRGSTQSHLRGHGKRHRCPSLRISCQGEKNVIEGEKEETKREDRADSKGLALPL